MGRRGAGNKLPILKGERMAWPSSLTIQDGVGEILSQAFQVTVKGNTIGPGQYPGQEICTRKGSLQIALWVKGKCVTTLISCSWGRKQC